MELHLFRASSSYLVVTDHALIDVERREKKNAPATGVLVGAALGGVLGAALSASLADNDDAPVGGSFLNLREPKPVPPFLAIDDVLTCDASDVPEELRAHPRWPRVDDHRSATFYPRAIVEWVTVALTGTVRIQPRSRESKTIGIDFWRAPQAKRALTQTGYVVR